MHRASAAEYKMRFFYAQNTDRNITRAAIKDTSFANVEWAPTGAASDESTTPSKTMNTSTNIICDCTTIT